MPDLFQIIHSWWKKIALLALVSTALAAAILMFQPRLYLSTVTALPANSLRQDQAHIFNPNIEQLYPSLGSADELEKFLGTANLQSLYNKVAGENNLAAHYGFDGDQAAGNAADLLRKRIKVQRNEWNQLQVKAWDRNPKMAATLANAFFEKMQLLHQQLEQQNNNLVLRSLMTSLLENENKRKLFQDSLAKSSGQELWLQARMSNLQNSIFETEKLIGHYELSVKNPLPALFVLEKAWPASRPDQPRFIGILLLAMFVSIVFGSLIAIFIESRRK